MVGLTIFVDRAFVEKASGVVYPVMIGMSWVARSYFKGPVFFFLDVPILLIIGFDVVCALGSSILGWVVPFLRSNIDNGCISRDVADIYRLNFLIRVVLDEVTLLSVF